ncbi:DNA glycosylase [Gautieria morchelliformis]|nr:DNA glycosylase [Gautieria morchelliformis]
MTQSPTNRPALPQLPLPIKRGLSLSPLSDLPEDDGHVQETSSSLKRPRPSSPPVSLNTSKKLKLLSTYAATSPFPDYPHPTIEEAHAVYTLLAQTHGERSFIRRPPSDTANSAQTCGNVPNILDSLIGTILSQNTSAGNSTRAKENLDMTFGKHNFAAIAEAPQPVVYDAIKHGGLAQKKSKTIQAILRSVHAKHGSYSLQHLASRDLTDTQVMEELQSYDGVGPKTASCVLLFCLARESFAVDTHVYRLSHLLDWVPKKAGRVITQAHLDVRIPGELKYGLHVLMIHHGRTCKGCKSHAAKGNCVLKSWLRDTKGIDDDVIEAKIKEA